MAEARALLVTPEAIYPPHGGGALRSQSVLEYLARRYATDVIVFREPGATDPVRQFPAGIAREIHVIDLPRHRKDPLSRAVRNAGRVLRAIPPLSDRFGGFGDQIAAAVRARRYDLAVVEHFWCAPYWRQIALVTARTVLDLHNIESVLHARCVRSESWPQGLAHCVFAKAARKLEARWLPCYDCLLTASDADGALAREISPQSNVVVYPNAIPLVPLPRAAERDMIAFSGNLEYHPNVSAVRFFHDEIWPRLRERWPGLVWRLIGKNPEAVRKHLDGDTRIELSGPVEDAIRELASAKVVVVPLLAGSGTRFKIIEAWAAGRAVVSTSVGAEGLRVKRDENLLLADNPAAFADAVTSLLASVEHRQRLGTAGRVLYENEYTWESAWKKLDL